MFLKEFEKVPYITRVSAFLGVPLSTVSSWKESDPEFARRYREIREGFKSNVCDNAEESVVEAAKLPRNPWLAVRILEQWHQDWKRDTQGNLSQVNIETMILNPNAPLDVPNILNSENVDNVDTGTDVPPMGHMGTDETHENTGNTSTQSHEGVGGGVADEGGGG